MDRDLARSHAKCSFIFKDQTAGSDVIKTYFACSDPNDWVTSWWKLDIEWSVLGLLIVWGALSERLKCSLKLKAVVSELFCSGFSVPYNGFVRHLYEDFSTSDWPEDLVPENTQHTQTKILYLNSHIYLLIMY